MGGVMEEAIKFLQNYMQKSDELFEELELKNKMVNLMLADISEGAFYADDAAQCCEVRKGDCIGNENTTCADCLMEYYRNKAGGK